MINVKDQIYHVVWKLLRLYCHLNAFFTQETKIQFAQTWNLVQKCLFQYRENQSCSLKMKKKSVTSIIDCRVHISLVYFPTLFNKWIIKWKKVQFMNQSNNELLSSYNLKITFMKTFLLVLMLTCFIASSFQFGSFSHKMDTKLRSMVHNSKINHKLRINHLTYTIKEQKFVDDFNAKLMQLIFGDPQIFAAMFSGQNLTEAQNAKILKKMLEDKDLPKFLVLSMREEPSGAWLAQLTPAGQKKFADIIIGQMKNTTSGNMTDGQTRNCFLKVLNDKDLAGKYVTYGTDFDIKALTSPSQFPQLQSKYPALKNINPKKITEKDKIFIVGTLIRDDAFWNNFAAEKKKQDQAKRASTIV